MYLESENVNGVMYLKNLVFSLNNESMFKKYKAKGIPKANPFLLLIKIDIKTASK